MIAMIAALTCGISTYYGVGDGFHGQTTANGERFDAYRDWETDRKSVV